MQSTLTTRMGELIKNCENMFADKE